MAITLEQLNIKIVGNSTDASASVDKLAASLRNLRGEAKEMASYGNAVNSAIRGMNKAAGGKEGAGLVGKHYRQVKEEATAAASAIDSVSQATSSTQTETKAAASAQKQYNSDLKQTKTAAGQAAKAVKETGDAAEKSSGKFSGFLKSIGRIAMYRAIRSAIKAVTRAVTEGYNEFVEWDRTYNNGMAGAAATSDELKRIWGELKFSIGAAIDPIVQLLLPFIRAVAGVLEFILDLIQQIGRLLLGDTKLYHGMFKEAEKTTGQAEALKRILFSFDELNVLPSKNGSGGGISGLDTGIADDGGKHSIFLTVLRDIFDWGEKVKNKTSELADVVKGKFALAWGSVKELFGKAEEAYKKLREYFGNNPLVFPLGLNPVPALVGLAKAMGDIRQTIENAKLQITTWLNAQPAWQALQDAIKQMREFLGSNPLEWSFRILTSSLAQIMADIRNALQKWWNENPILIPTKADGKLSGAGSTSVAAIDLGGDREGSKARAYVPAPPVAPVPGYSAALGNTTSGKQRLTLTAEERNNYSPSYEPQLSPWEAFPAINPNSQYAVNAARLAQADFSDARKNAAIKRYLAGEPVSDSDWGYIEEYLADMQSLGTSGALGILGSLFGGGLQGLGAGAGAGNLLRRLAPAAYASGGTPDMGTLFYAGENGAEVVANMGNHQSGVLNVMQMQAAMEGANEGVVGAVMAMSNAVVNAIRNKDTNVYMDGEVISRKVTRSQNNTARRFGEGMA